MRIFLVRHGEAIKLENDSILTKKGLKQSKNVAKALAKIPIDLVFTSNLTRATQTLEEYKKLNGSVKVEISPEISEIYRVIIGGPEKEGTSENREEKDKTRSDNFFANLLKLKKENIAIFSHGNIIRYFLSKALNVDPKGLWEKIVISPGSISIIEINKKGMTRVKAINLYEHQKQFLEDFFNGEIISENYLQ